MLDRPFLSRFSPQRTDPEALEQILVQRHDLLAESVERIRDSVLTDNKHHLLFIGPRGIGKTNLVSLIVHRLKKQPKLQSKMRLAWLNEDETATSFLKLLILIYRDLTQRYPDEFLAADLQKVYGHKPDHARELLGASLLEHLGKRTLVVIMENLDSLFKDMPVEEQRTWRAFVQNHPVFATVGTAQSLFDGVSERTEPFFGFFDTRHLDNLTVDEAITLLRNVAKLNRDDKLEAYLATPTGHARVQAIHDLAGGNPRIYMIFSSFLTVELLDDLVRSFEETADQQLTSYYQERLRWLSAQQREIVQYLCQQRFPVPVKQIAEGMFATHQTIANQLKILRDYRYVRGNERGREVLYELSEPLMRLALQVKETHDGKPLSLIVDFLRIWYDRSELIGIISNHCAQSTSREYFAAALRLIESDEPNLRHLILRQHIVSLGADGVDDHALSTLRVLAAESEAPQDLSHLGLVLMTKGLTREAVAVFDKLLLIPNHSPEEQSLWLVARAYALISEGKPDAAREDCTRVIDNQESPRSALAQAFYCRGVLNQSQRLWNEAVLDLTSAERLEQFDSAMMGALLYLRAWARNNLSQFDDALDDFAKAIKTDTLDKQRLADARAQRGVLLVNVGRYDEAIREFEAVIANSSESDFATTKVSILMGFVFSQSGNETEALSHFRRLFHVPRESFLPYADTLGEVISEHCVTSLLGCVARVNGWQDFVTEFTIYALQKGILERFGESLVNQLPRLASSSLNHSAYDAWADAWTNAANSLKPEDRQHLEIPLRLLRTGIAYYKTKDEGVLLSLPSEERKILRQVLKLDPEPAA